MLRRLERTAAPLAIFVAVTGCGLWPTEVSGTRAANEPATAPVTPQGQAASTPSPESSPSITTPPAPAEPTVRRGDAIPYYARDTEIKITVVEMVDATTGWAHGHQAGDSDHILRSDDGGENWWDVTPPQGRPPAGEELLAESFFLDESTAWVSYEPYEIVWRTTDAAITWQPARVPTVAHLGSRLWFLDADNGWMLKYLDAGMNHVYSALYRTTSGGRSWEKLFDPYSDGGVQSFAKTGLVFASAEIGWLTRDPQGVQPGAFVDATSDGGLTWEQVGLPPPADEPDKFDDEFCGMFSPTLFSTSTGAVVVTCRAYEEAERITSHFLVLTADAGDTWELRDYPGGQLRFIDQNTAYALGREIFKSNDGGRSWTNIRAVNWDGQFSFVDENLAWAVARSGEEIALVRTTDGGRTFSEIEPIVIDPPAAYAAPARATETAIDPAALGGGSGQIAFISYRENADRFVSDIYLMNIDGSGLREITDSSGSITHFSWSPDGERLVFDSDRDGDSEIYVIGVDGTGLTQLTSNSFADTDPAWSPDGTQIAYATRGSDADGIYLMNEDGSSSRYLTQGRTPEWSPDGSVLALARIEDGIYTIASDGSRLLRLTDSSRHDWDHYPVWSPDGGSILFGSNRHQPGWAAAETVYWMGADGTGVGQLTEVWGQPPYAWSPDGQWIAYTQGFGSGAQLYLMDAGGFRTWPLMEENEGLHPSWRP